MDFKELIQTDFSIGDLEKISGIRAHTLRVWEQRYYLFDPKRDSNNVRIYSLSDLQKLLNISTLYAQGISISKIASLSEEELKNKVLKVASNSDNVLKNFILSVLSFDKLKFNQTFATIRGKYEFRTLFNKYFIPLNEEIGKLWQLGAINEAHEHFVSFLMKEKILESFLTNVKRNHKKFKNFRVVLFLPENELHELGLLYVYYELLLMGIDAIYLGSSTPNSALTKLTDWSTSTIFITQMTLYNGLNKTNKFLEEFQNDILKNNNELWITGNVVRQGYIAPQKEKIKLITNINDLFNEIEQRV